MQEASPSKADVLGATMLVTGGCIGGGMLALPAGTSLSGAVPSIVAMLLAWFFMTLTALLLLEISLFMKDGSHFGSMARRFLGPAGAMLGWVIYLFICYASMVAYMDGSGNITMRVVRQLSGYTLSEPAAMTLFSAFFGSAFYFGARYLGTINTMLCLGMGIAFLGVVGYGIDEVRLENLSHKNWGYTWLAGPLLLTSFSFQTVIPSLTPYLKRNAKLLRFSIILGTTLALVTYIIWECLVMGVVPFDPGLVNCLALDAESSAVLAAYSTDAWLLRFTDGFAFFALTTSFLSTGLGLYDFLADGFSVPKKGFGALVLFALVMVPCYIFTVLTPGVFLAALNISGGVGDSIVNGMMPVLMMWVACHKHQHKPTWPLLASRPLLVAAFVFYVCILFVQLAAPSTQDVAKEYLRKKSLVTTVTRPESQG